MHEIHTTPGFIIASKNYGEADKLLSVFTRNFGLIVASARGIRLIKSKLRYAAGEYSFGEYSFVRGKEIWRLTDACNTTSPDVHVKFYARLAILLGRFLHGEETNSELFDCVQNCHQFLRENNNISLENLETLESLTVARMMYSLGYMGDDKDLNSYLHSVELTYELLDVLESKRKILNQHINKALRESHL